MPMPRKDDPVRHCETCGTRLERKRMNGRLEDMGAFMRRRYCDRICMGLARISDTPGASALRSRSSRLRGASCEACGSTTNLHGHHIDGDLHNISVENIQTLCGSCHTSHHMRARHAGAEIAGRLIVPGPTTTKEIA